MKAASITHPFLDLRSFLQALEHSDRLRRVSKSVDKDWELACIARWALESTSEKDSYAILFENVKNYSIPVVVNLFSTPEMYASALGVSANEILERWGSALEKPLSPIPVDSGPVQDVIHLESEADLFSIPAPVWTPGRDGGPYLSGANVITKDPDTGVQKMGIYRMQIHDSKHAGLYFAGRMQHGAIHFKKWTNRQQPMPVAAVVGAAPAVIFASAAKLPYGVDELTIAGALTGTPLEVVRGKTVDLLVPARAECVIEGLVHADMRREEGPFGEYLGYVNGATPATVVEITAITHREAYVHHGFVQQMPPSDGHLVMEMGILGPLWLNLVRKLKVKGLRNLAIARGSAGLSILIAAIEKSHVSESARIGRLLAKFNSGLKFIYLVDEDVEIRDQDTLNWALSSQVNPPQDIEFVQSFMTPRSDAAENSWTEGENLAHTLSSSSVAIVNATTKSAMTELSLPGASLMLKVKEQWAETGLPPLTPRKRLEKLLKTL
jgi:2,5-furandicarboxylate decarboxylase 1